MIGSAISYEEAFQAYNLRRPDLVLLDIRLYGTKSGIDFAAYLKEQVNGPPFIFLSSQNDQKILEQALETNPYGPADCRQSRDQGREGLPSEVAPDNRRNGHR